MGNANKKPLSDECDTDSDSSSDSRPGEIILVDLTDSDEDLNPEDAKVIKNRYPDALNDVEKYSDGGTKTHEMEKEQAGIKRGFQDIEDTASQRKTQLFCGPCNIQRKTAIAMTFCPVCDNDLLCALCSSIHNALPVTNSHTVLDVSAYPAKNEGGNFGTGYKHFCNLCLIQKVETEAILQCQECETQLCDSCSNQHKAQKATRSHNVININDETPNTKRARLQPPCTSTSPDEEETKTPSRPTAHSVTSDTLTLAWTKPTQFEEGNYFQIGYKESESNWRIYSGEFTECTQVLTNIKCNTEYIFRVRAVYSDGEGPYSKESAVVKTPNSAAFRLCEVSVRSDDGVTPPFRYALPMREITEARNVKAKTRKFVLGSPKDTDWKEKTLLMIGETGKGKSTLVDGMANFILGVTWNDPFRFNIVNLEDEEKKKVGNQAVSQTEWITCYAIYPHEGSRIPYTINIIDTPGFGDTRGLDRDQEIVEQIRELFSAKPPRGVLSIDAVCFLIKAPDARLTPVQSYIFQSIMSLFGKDIEDNICSLITFADGMDPPVLAAIKESGLPFGERFTFNNSGLFARNMGLSQSSLSPMFWDMGLVSFRNFFNHLDSLETKSLQLTSDVLYERSRLEATIRNLQPMLDVGLNKISELKSEINIFQENKSIIADNKDFTYVVPTTKHIKIDLPSGLHVTNCTYCNFTCHENCTIVNDAEKIGCWAMTDGFCRICPERCFWNQHANTPYIFDYITVDETKTYAEMKKKYEEASGKLLTQEQVLDKMREELDEIDDMIQTMMLVVRDCNIRLGKIALRPNPLSMTQHIDLMIESETMEKKDGWYERVQTLYRFRKRAQVVTDAESFFKEAINLGVTGCRRKDKETIFRRFRDMVEGKRHTDGQPTSSSSEASNV
ncbi:uncharacterized protein LOC127845594 isoform X1 [Dreissena polymorpha]|uniref:Fibronectin type-III domain-containing protein n=1 Tax=Dreissena polymorpha TaxID=45954 RepID=A0A9D4ICA7_DREPO|nr:uncharacterized protein LOC127845594 isoform X1 [Dreissena polymorpha]KAH3768560.1 hypothetical protein DPMN_169775 [Dreissena polymorpha]